MTQTIPTDYRAIGWHAGTGAFVEQRHPTPTPKGHDLLVQVRAVSVNPVDLKVKGYGGPDDPPKVLGYDAVGEVLAVGDTAQGFVPGDRVWYAGAAHRPGTNAERHLVDARIVARAPQSLGDAAAAALPLTAITAWEALFERLHFTPRAGADQPGRLLVINGAGGVGSMTLQLARLFGIDATATAARAASVAWCRDMGAADVIPHSALADLPEKAFERILCCHDADAYFDTMARLVAPGGIICSLTGPRRPYDLMPLFFKSAGFVWEYMFARPLHAPADIGRQGEILATIAGLLDQGALRSTLTTELTGLSVDTLARAHEASAAGRQIGKLAITY